MDDLEGATSRSFRTGAALDADPIRFFPAATCYGTAVLSRPPPGLLAGPQAAIPASGDPLPLQRRYRRPGRIGGMLQICDVATQLQIYLPGGVPVMLSG